ncbi:MAG: nucleotidyltransferase family protein [bacterium]|nr:nucleotidyltransferase family protein [bacterium]
MKKYIGIILAGGIENGELSALLDDRKIKPLLDIEGTSMIQRLINAIDQVDLISEIFIVGRIELKEIITSKKPLQFFENKGKVIDGIKIGYSKLPEDREAIFFTDDIPLLTRDALVDFIFAVEREKKDAIYIFVDKKTMEKTFPGSTRTFFKLKEGEFCGGDVGYVNRYAFNQTINLIQKLFSQRKNTFALIKLLGLWLTFKFLIKRLSIRDIEKRIEKMLKFTISFYCSPHAEIAMDIDKLIHYNRVVEYLKKNNE